MRQQGDSDFIWATLLAIPCSVLEFHFITEWQGLRGNILIEKGEKLLFSFITNWILVSNCLDTSMQKQNKTSII